MENQEELNNGAPVRNGNGLVGQNQVQDLLFNREIGWQDIIYDLINTEQLDPWDVDIVILTNKYLEKVQELEEADFFISSKVLLAASLLLRIKSEILLNKYIRSIDDILFGRKEDTKKSSLERIELEDEIPELIPRSPMPRFRKVTLKELLESLNKAIITENRRIKKEIVNKRAVIDSSLSLPKKNINIRDKIREIFNNIISHFRENQDTKKIPYSVFIGEDPEKKIGYFSPLLHLEHQHKVWLEQEKHFDEINIWMKATYFKHMGDPYADLKEEISNTAEELSQENFISDEEFEKFAERYEGEEEKDN
jgi:segregation and condensation protein A